MDKDKLVEDFGWLGMFSILLAYALVSINLIESNSLEYHSLNLLGALGIIVVSLHKKVWQSVGLNIAWLIIAGVALLSIIFSPDQNVS